MFQYIDHPGRDAGFIDPGIGFILFCQGAICGFNLQVCFGEYGMIIHMGAEDVLNRPFVFCVGLYDFDNLSAFGRPVFRKIFVWKIMIK